MHISRIKNKVVATTLATTIIASNVGTVVHADAKLSDNATSNIVKAGQEEAKPVIHAQDLYVELGSVVDVKEGVEATDVDGSTITEDVEVEGLDDTTIDTSREHRQTVMYKVTNGDGKTTYKSRDIYVVKKEEVQNPTIKVDEYGVVTLEDKGVRKSFATDKFSNKNWGVTYFDVVKPESGVDSGVSRSSLPIVPPILPLMEIKQGDKVIASDLLNGEATETSTTYTLELDKADTLRIDVSVDGVDSGKVGKVYIDDELIYDTETFPEDCENAYDTYTMITSELDKGTHEIVFEFSKKVGSVDVANNTIDAHRMYIHSMSLTEANEDLLEGVLASDTLQYSINDGRWLDYTSPIDLKDIAREDLPRVSVNSRALFTGVLGDVESPSTVGTNESVLVPVLVKPTIEAKNVTINVGDAYNVRKWATAKDADGNDITADIEVVTSNINNKAAGVYNVTYRVTTKMGASTTKTITVTVKAKDVSVDKGEAPVITLEKDTIELEVGDSFNALSGVSATDKEDGNLTHKINVVTNTVNSNIVGDYVVVYEVEDKDGNKTTKTLNVVVRDSKGEVPVIHATDREIVKGSVFDPYEGVTVTDKEDIDLTDFVKVVYNNVDTNKVGVYSVEYEVYDTQGNKATKKIKVTVKDVNVGLGEAPVIHASDKTVTVGTTVNVLEGVTATDKEDGDITNKIEILSNPLNTQIAGKYTVQLGVKDSSGNVTVKDVVYNVIATTTSGGDNTNNTNNGTQQVADTPIINAADIVIPLGMNMAYILEGVTATDAIDGNLTGKIQVKSTNIDFNKEGDYKVTFLVTNSKGVSVEREINVKVSATATVNNNGNESANGTTQDGGANGTTPENVKTFDNVNMYLGGFIASMLSSIGIFLRIKKRD